MRPSELPALQLPVAGSPVDGDLAADIAGILRGQFPSDPAHQLHYAAHCLVSYLREHLAEHAEELGLRPELRVLEDGYGGIATSWPGGETRLIHRPATRQIRYATDWKEQR
ncbi:hypothetical protein B8W67_14035 [Mycolicibacillus koreensis]|uniref:Uncharacterized protein n=1 Tax=Mycolicibacillus koreensis TaxID=1069220 RepID=A0AA91PD00_9MYCO|nr:hypothetical protein B8W67_14035 [Mycolicibacillus koreensis]